VLPPSAEPLDKGRSKGRAKELETCCERPDNWDILVIAELRSARVMILENTEA
jgi:hypothetical protein